MNREINYILQAAFILCVVGASSWIIARIPPDRVSNDTGIQTDPGTPEPTEISKLAAKGKLLFYANCAACHSLFKDQTGPSLAVSIRHERWSDHKRLLAWINNPAGFMQTDAYTRGLKEKFGTMMTAFPAITLDDVDAIVAYLNEGTKPVY